MPTDQEGRALFKQVPIKRHDPDGLPTLFASNVVIQNQPDFFVLSFYDVHPPMILGETDDEKAKAAEQVDHVDATCVARIVLTPPRVRELINALAENLANHERMLKLQAQLSGE